MKKLPIILVVAAAVLVACTPATSSNNNSGNNGSSPSNPANLPASGATSAPTSLNAIFNAFNSIPSTDPVIVDLQGSFSSLGTNLTTPTSNVVASAFVKTLRSFKGSGRSLSSDLTTQVNNLITAVNNFSVASPITASNGTVSVSGDYLSTYFKLTTATGALLASESTSDGLALASDGSNFKSATGSANLDLQIDLVNPPAASALKYLTIQANVGLSATVTPSTGSTVGSPSNVAFTYNAQNYLVAVSFNNNGTGGKIVLTVSLPAYNGTLSTSSLTSSSASSFASTPTIVLTVYDDSGNNKFSKTWTDLGQFQTDISSL